MKREGQRLQVVFFGNSHSHFSDRFFQALLATTSELVGLVDSPGRKRGSTNPLTGGGKDMWREAERRGAAVLEPDDPNDPEFVETIREMRPDLFLAVGYTNILRAPILQAPICLAANFHASLLPAYRGKHPVFWCLRNGERWSGLTVHVMDTGIDTGDILYQEKVRTHKADSVGSLYERIIERSLPLVARLVEGAGQGSIQRKQQSQDGASYFSSVSEEDFRIDWGLPAETLRRWISASPGECFALSGKERIYLLEAGAVSLPAGRLGGFRLGEIYRIGREWGTIATQDGGLRVRRLRRESGETLTFRQWCEQVGLRAGMRVSDRITG
jgi:methionyl-tRNA formyltransferase